MPPEIGSTVPATIMQGDTLRWRFTSRDATPQTATLAVRVSSPTQTVEVPGTPDADGWLVTVSAEQTKRLGAGLLRYLVRATYTGGIVQTLASGSINALRVSELGAGGDTLTFNARRVKLLEAQYEKLAGDSLAEYSVGERTAKRRDLKQVREELAMARAALQMEQTGGKLVGTAVWFGNGE